MPEKIKYCTECSNTGIRLDGSPCPCRMHESELYVGMECLDIPETYRGLRFSETSLPPDMGTAYSSFMKNTYTQLTSMSWRCKNMIICSPPQTGKSVLAYSVIQELFRKNIPVFQVFDILEIKRIMLDVDYNKSQSMGLANPADLYTVPYLFAIMPPITNYDTFDTAAMLISRRTRRGNSTILLYEGHWNQLVCNDSKGSLKNLKGNGSLTTVEVNSWERKNKENTV